MGQTQGCGCFEEVRAEAVGVTGHEEMEHFADLAAEDGIFLYELAALAGEHLELLVVVGPVRFQQAEAVDRGAEDGRQIGVVGLVARIGGLAVMLGGQRMNEACVKVGAAKGMVDQLMISAGPFDGDDEITQLMDAHGLPYSCDGSVQIFLSVQHRRRLDQDVAIKITEQILGPPLGTIDADDAKMLRPGRLHPIVDFARRFKHEKPRSFTRPARST